MKVGAVVVTDPQYENNNALHGIPMTENAFEHLVSIESPYRYEMIDGIVYDMTGSSPEHSMIRCTLAQDHSGL
jgi:Uma2 family endonuclease